MAAPEQRALLEDALAVERLVPASFDIQGVPGFQLKGEDRSLFVTPRHLRVRPSERDPLNRGLRLIKLRFELPRGSYATLVVKRLLARPLDSSPRPGDAGTGDARGHAPRPRGQRPEHRGDERPRPERGSPQRPRQRDDEHRRSERRWTER